MNMQQRPPEHKVTAPPPPPALGGQSLEGGCGQGGLRARAPSPNTEPRVPQGGGTREVAVLPPPGPLGALTHPPALEGSRAWGPPPQPGL